MTLDGPGSINIYVLEPSRVQVVVDESGAITINLHTIDVAEGAVVDADGAILQRLKPTGDVVAFE